MVEYLRVLRHGGFFVLGVVGYSQLRFAETMTWKGKYPHVELVSDAYRKGIRLAQKEMKSIEAQVQRLPGLEKWFVDIPWCSGVG